MNNVIVFIAPTVDNATRQKLAESFRIRGIATTDKMRNATLVIADVAQLVARMSIADFAEKLIEEYAQEIAIVNREILYFNHKGKKPEFNPQHTLKKFNQTKQIYRQRFFNRTNHK